MLFGHQARVRRLALLALLSVFLISPQQAQGQEVSFVFHTISWGMTRGQTVRFSVSNPSEQSFFFQVRLLDASGGALATSDEVAIPPGEFRSVDFNRDDLTVGSDPSGRVQTRAQIRYRTFSIVERTQLIPAIELIDDLSGRTTLLASSKPKEIVVVGSPPPPTSSGTQVELPVIVYAGRSLIGLTNGHTLRVNAVYSGDSAEPQRRSARVRARVSLFDAAGTLLVQSAEAVFGLGEFRSFDFDRGDIPGSGEPAGARLQMRVSLEVTASPTALTRDSKATPIATSLELFDNSTARSNVFAVWLTTGFFEVANPPRPQ